MLLYVFSLCVFAPSTPQRLLRGLARSVFARWKDAWKTLEVDRLHATMAMLGNNGEKGYKWEWMGETGEEDVFHDAQESFARDVKSKVLVCVCASTC